MLTVSSSLGLELGLTHYCRRIWLNTCLNQPEMASKCQIESTYLANLPFLPTEWTVKGIEFYRYCSRQWNFQGENSP